MVMTKSRYRFYIPGTNRKRVSICLTLEVLSTKRNIMPI
jgi:hypothetical protein